ncbi:MAG: hypothetical protein KC478_08170, partial [Bacteriovoracaceae bacterium]|nr:hypothetical protein [Bacteriovoracaceae bacterium]
FSFENAQLQTVASFCDGEKLVVDYVDYNFQLVTRLNLPMKYSQEQQCRNSLDRIKDTLSKHGVNTLIATCEKSVTFPMKEIFTPTIDVSRHYSIEIKSILGKRLSRDETCSIDAVSIQRALESVDVELGEAGCSEYGNHSYEYILYVKKSKTPFIQTFKGGVYSSESACQEQLEKAVDAIESMGKTTIYKYCTNSGASSVPVIYYAR